MLFMDILSKDQSRIAIKKYNILRHWETIRDIETSGYNGFVNVRDSRPSTKIMKYGILMKDLHNVVLKMDVPENILYFNETAPDEYILIQGELMQSDEHLDLTYSFEKASNRKALMNPSFARGLTAKMLIERYMDRDSLDDINEILESYPDHIIEFSTFSIKLGSLNKNTIIWEIRKF